MQLGAFRKRNKCWSTWRVLVKAYKLPQIFILFCRHASRVFGMLYVTVEVVSIQPPDGVAFLKMCFPLNPLWKLTLQLINLSGLEILLTIRYSLLGAYPVLYRTLHKPLFPLHYLFVSILHDNNMVRPYEPRWTSACIIVNIFSSYTWNHFIDVDKKVIMLLYLPAFVLLLLRWKLGKNFQFMVCRKRKNRPRMRRKKSIVWATLKLSSAARTIFFLPSYDDFLFFIHLELTNVQSAGWTKAEGTIIR